MLVKFNTKDSYKRIRKQETLMQNRNQINIIYLILQTYTFKPIIIYILLSLKLQSEIYIQIQIRIKKK
ncbi:hypothetical protein pb186bvf_008279 [Paramecium bursaria]